MSRQRGFTLIELLIVVAIIGIIAAIAIPSLLRARISANEAGAVADTRTVMSAEAAYHSANSAFYGAISCLGTPTLCLPSYPATGPTFLDPVIVSLSTKSGYARSFSTDTTNAAGITGAANAYCYQARPATGQGGVRSFGGDSDGVIGQTNTAFDCCSGGGFRSPNCTAIR